MLERGPKLETQHQPAAILPPALAPLPPAALARRRRLVRLVGLFSVLGGLGLSAIPGPKRSSPFVTTETENGVTMTIHRFAYSQTYGVPFPVVRVEFQREGIGISNLSAKGPAILGNVAVAFALVIGITMLIGALRRRD